MSKNLDLVDTKDELKRLAQQQNDKVSHSLFYWIMGGIGALISIGIIIISGILSYTLNRVDQVDLKHQVDHDKITKLETIIETLKK